MKHTMLTNFIALILLLGLGQVAAVASVETDRLACSVESHEPSNPGLTYTISGTVSAAGSSVLVPSIIHVYQDGITTQVAALQSNGTYSIQVPAGTNYVVQAEPLKSRSYWSEFYPNSITRQGATRIDVNGDVSNIDFSVDSVYLIRGRITRAGTSTRVGGHFEVFQDGVSEPVVEGSAIGLYSIPVREGTGYVVVVYPADPAYMTEYYYNSYTMAGATRIAVHGNLSNIDFAIDSIPVNYHVISGTIKGEGSFALEPWDVFIYQDGVTEPIGSISTSGNYSILVPDGTGYVVKAVPRSPVYRTEFYDDSPTMAGATRISVGGDVDNIDFTLDIASSIFNKIVGFVKDEAGVTNSATVIAHKLVTQNGVTTPVEMYTSEYWRPTTQFRIFDLDPGTYILQVRDCDTTLVPGYYKENSVAVPAWQDATPVTIAAHDSLCGLIFTLEFVTTPPGTNVLEGFVHSSAHGFTGAPLPLENTVVYLYNSEGKVCDRAVSGNQGHYRLNKAASGEFSVKADLGGYQRYDKAMNLKYAANESRELEILLDPLSATSVGPLPQTSLLDVKAFPNPANAVAHLQFNEAARNVRVRVFNRLGIQFYDEQYTSVAAGSSVSIATAGLNSGMYFIRVDGGKNATTVPFTIVK